MCPTLLKILGHIYIFHKKSESWLFFALFQANSFFQFEKKFWSCVTEMRFLCKFQHVDWMSVPVSTTWRLWSFSINSWERLGFGPISVFYCEWNGTSLISKIASKTCLFLLQCSDGRDRQCCHQCCVYKYAATKVLFSILCYESTAGLTCGLQCSANMQQKYVC